MPIIEILFYKQDENTNQMRISKTKIITSIVFVIFFVFSINMYFTTPSYGDVNIMAKLLSSIIFGLIFAVPTFIIGWLISKYLNHNNSKINYENNTTHHVTTQDIINTSISENMKQDKCPHNYAEEFKKAVEIDDVDLASNILSKWNQDDANYKYAKIIFEGMPPTELSLKELNEMLNIADNMNACDKSLKEWFKSTAIEVITLNK